MVFIRVKRINNKEYAYLVANSWTDSGPRQKVAKYLGRLIRPEKAKNEGLAAFLELTSDSEMAAWLQKSSFGEIAATLVKLELGNHSIRALAAARALINPTDGGLKINAEKAEFIDEKGKNVVLALNDGFLCSHTAKKLLEYNAEAAANDYSGYNLADALTAAGIAVDKDVFISLFGKMQAVATAKKQEGTAKDAFKDFYY